MVYFIEQDLEGFIWVSSQIGVHRYDGYSFKTYSNSELHLAERIPAQLAIDSQNRLWMSSRGPAHLPGRTVVLDIKADTLYNLESITRGICKPEEITYTCNPDPGSSEVIVANDSGGVFRYTDKFEKLFQLPFPETYYYRIKKGTDGSYWIGHKNALFRVKEGEETIEYRADLDPDELIWDVTLIDGKTILEVAIKNTYHYKYLVLDGDTLIPYHLKGADPERIPKRLLTFPNYELALTSDSLLIYDYDGKPMASYPSFRRMGKREYISVNKTMEDVQGNHWITTDNGLYKLAARRNPFSIQHEGLGSFGILKVKDQLWMGGDPKLMMEDQKSKKRLAPPLNRGVINFFEDEENRVWIAGGVRGILMYDPPADSLKWFIFHELYGMNLPFQNPVTKHYWVGTAKGLYRIDPLACPSDTCHIGKNLLPDAPELIKIMQFYPSKEGIWVVTNYGLYLMDSGSETLIKHYSKADGLPFDNLNHIYQDEEGILWLASRGGGLIRWDRLSQSFQQFTVEDGLSHNNLYAVYEDDFETLWLPSDYGLMAFDKTSHTTKLYLPQNGIAHEEFNTFSHFQDEEGYLYFGGLSGITHFHPRDLQVQEEQYVPPLLLTKVQVLEKDAETFSDRTSRYKEMSEIILSPNDRILEIELTYLDYEALTDNQYAYYIKGYQDQWVYTSDNRITLINLPYGNFELVIKARGASGGWTTKMLRIPIYMSSPFYIQTWFIALMVALAITIIWFAVRLRLRALKKDRERLEREVAKRTQKIAIQAEELKELDQVKTQFFANITHEFRTPLTLVIGPIEQSIEELPSNPMRNRLKGVLRNARNLLGLVNQLLDLSKLESHRMQIEVSRGDIVEYTQGLVEQFLPLARQKHILLSFSSITSKWNTHFDHDKWNKTVYNLLSNAIKFTPATGKVEVRLKQVQEHSLEFIQLEVKDTGSGIPTDNLDQVFDRFYQVNSTTTRAQGGSGIGLALVKELVELQKGNISVDSVVGEGTSFVIKLPVYPEPTNSPIHIPQLVETIQLPDDIPDPDHERSDLERSIDKKGRSASGETGVLGKLELLIIEDNDEMRSYIRSCLNADQFKISEAKNGEEGIEKAIANVPDLIISDVMMPKKDGFEVTRSIRDHLATSHIPLILLTAKASLESRLEGLKRGADAYLTKPFSPHELVIRIHNLIDLRRQLQARYQQEQDPENPSQPYPKMFEAEATFISQLKAFIADNLQNTALNVELISVHFGMSRTQLYRKIQSLTDVTISDLIRTARCALALEMLKEKKLTIARIAYEVGYASPGHFSRSFKKHFGKSPSAMAEEF